MQCGAQGRAAGALYSGVTEAWRERHLGLSCPHAGDVDGLLLARGKVVRLNRPSGAATRTCVVGSCAGAWTSPSAPTPGDLRKPTAEARVLLPFTPHMERCAEREVVFGASVPRAVQRSAAVQRAGPPDWKHSRVRQGVGCAASTHQHHEGTEASRQQEAKFGELTTARGDFGRLGRRVFPSAATIDEMRA